MPESTSRSPKPEGTRPRRINRLVRLLGARSYLEVGVAGGATFFAVDVANKVAVDPRFAFDVDARRGPGVEFHAVPSDTFFAGLDEQVTFDVIYLDGLHIFEQTYRDFTNALAHSHPRTIIMIDDTVPSSLYSAQRDRQAMQAERKQQGNTELAWHGDIYKMLAAIHDFHPSYNYVTFSTGGAPQSMVWRSKGFARSPLFDSLEAVQRLDYWKMRTLPDMRRALPEPEAFALLTADLTARGWPIDPAAG